MPNSSDWVAALQKDGPSREHEVGGQAAPAWIEALLEQGEFTEGLPVARSAQTRAQAEHQEQAAPPPAMPAPSSAPSTADALDPIAAAFAKGEAAGRSEMQAIRDAEQDRIRALRLTFRNFDQAAMDSLASELADTVIALCGQALSDFVPEPEKLRARCDAAAKRLGTAVQDCALHLHPDDIDRLDPAMHDQWRIVGDDSVARGGLHFEGPNGSISDGPKDWHRAIAVAIRG